MHQPPVQKESALETIYEEPHSKDNQYRSQSCTIPNSIFQSKLSQKKEDIIHDRYPSSQKQNSTFSLRSLSEYSGRFAFLWLMVGILYLFILYQPRVDVFNAIIQKNSSNDQKSSFTKQAEDCFTSFKKNNCNLDSPKGQICQKLRKCMEQLTVNKPNYAFNMTIHSQDKEKISKLGTLEEFFENVLLLIGGIGLAKVYPQLRFLPRYFRLLYRFVEVLRVKFKKERKGKEQQ